MSEVVGNSKCKLPVSIYFVWQWWQEQYQKNHVRPETIDMAWLDESYLGRQKLLYKHCYEAIPQVQNNFFLTFL
ncbi:hypothetical protein ACFL3G_12570 [Planctomycetota bacterium]